MFSWIYNFLRSENMPTPIPELVETYKDWNNWSSWIATFKFRKDLPRDFDVWQPIHEETRKSYSRRFKLSEEEPKWVLKNQYQEHL